MKRLSIVALSLVTALSLAAAPTSAYAATGGITIPVVGSGPGGTFTGSLKISKFVADATGVDAVGTLSGTVTTTAGVVSSIVKTVTLPVSIGATSCDILHLDIGPISLDLLGLEIDLSRIVLDITAQSGAGNLLGNLLCAVAGLLDNPSALAKLLNDILALL
jgi:hypothetical protein